MLENMHQNDNSEEILGNTTDHDRRDEPEEFSACQSCRKRKLKCSRETPACSQCSRLSCPCIYDRKKQKPGLRSGAVESLNQRISVLEGLLLNGECGSRAPPNNAALDVRGCMYHAALLIANSVKRPVEGSNELPVLGQTLYDCQRRHLSTIDTHTAYTTCETNATKRRRTDESNCTTRADRLGSLPGRPALDRIFKMYFCKIHPWLPCVHQPTFEARLINLTHDEKLVVLVHAMVCVTLKHMKLDEICMEESERNSQIHISRDTVIRMAMADMSVESLQAMIIVASDRMGDGDLISTSPIIGSLTRTVEYLQLTIEVDEKPKPAFLRPIILLEDSQTWAEAEERRRVFWNVFILDRLCSVTAGWSTSLTSSDVRRRLPCDGKIWAQGEKAVTPYFGIWDKSAAKIGNPISSYNIPTARSPSSPESSWTNASPASESLQVGAFAYRIEATESLCQVTSFFLQQPVDFSNRQEVSSWLTRFKELDLRLVHWKNLLPSKWKDSNVSRDETVVKMDPNLTLAHVTHNTSMILLHQHIAYPSDQLSNIVRLPSSCSAETCQLAAIETSSISQKFLTYSESEIVVAQFSFCAFVAARVLLVHWKFYGTPLATEYFNLLQSLRDMSRRWQGYLYSYSVPVLANDNNERKQYLDLAGRYVALLEALHSKCLNEPDLSTEKLFQYDIITGLGNLQSSADISPRSTTAARNTTVNQKLSMAVDKYMAQQNNPQFWESPSNNMAVPGNESGSHNPTFTRVYTGNGISDATGSYGHADPNTHAHPAALGLNGTTTDDELTLMSNVLLDHQFSQMDRVITLDGTDFGWDMNSLTVNWPNPA